MTTGLDRIIQNHDRSLEESWTPNEGFKYSRYAISNLRGGIGKSTISFNLAYTFSRQMSTLVLDLCPQRNLTESITRSKNLSVTIADAMRPKVLGPAFGVTPEDISYRLSKLNDNFKGGKKSYLVAGDGDLFSFPSSLYQQLQQAMAASNKKAVKNILLSLGEIINAEMEDKSCSVCLMDCSPFYAGATHLAWCASDAIIIPVRVDEHSIDSLELTLKMLADKDSDYNMWSDRAGGLPSPKIAAIVMTMVGARSPKKGVKDLASRMYVERAYNITAKYPQLFDYNDPADAFAITDDFMSAGRISGAQSIPIPMLQVGTFTTIDGKRLQVNKSQVKYKRELEYLTDIL
ncbi:ParA family protein [Rhodomicrobium sp. Az07]|uniref:ParA family protein n=1 Tax=Rhodomicrobium sp. Az07 TaxID=2839034 RepID=UPI001BE7D370|nr:ParA family protein [Rhodomicrobium sp. Az07]MBT3069369.1 ParA family protein [Rhodomicrobium sp. Az07]